MTREKEPEQYCHLAYTYIRDEGRPLEHRCIKFRQKCIYVNNPDDCPSRSPRKTGVEYFYEN